jgi:hypothetical protein
LNFAFPRQEIIAALSWMTAKYIGSRHRKYAARGLALSTQQRATMAGFFSAELLGAARIVELRQERLVNPRLYAIVQRLAGGALLQASNLKAITFSDTIVSQGPCSTQTLFHELVHVEQFRQLGATAFSELYVRGFAKSGSYEHIPLEEHAYELELRFARDPSNAFPVTDDVAAWVRASVPSRA